MGNGKSYWTISTTVWASEAEMRLVEEQIERILCPDPDHAPPCPVPWEVTTTELTEPDQLRGLSLPDQVQRERAGGPGS